ncbi:hypothetical protein [Rufibacter hautae]|uniref:Uncharacterized protein n=1 Tax=Rufibacter hautae TaxID=2595005 RepID=A0A5B6T9U7_9BACT|nr:hypothetical protein [Rufibacter hautae]KAA3436968.1 hypothetical protein FOA19_21575 [Rufibacter hautae]
MSQFSQNAPKTAFTLSSAIGVYQLVGGLLGLGLFLKMIPALENPSATTWLGILLAALLYGFSIWCGFSLLKKTRSAYTLSMVNQILQAFSFGMSGVAYNYVAGLKVGVGIDFLASWVFKLRFSLSSFNFSFGTHAGISFVSVNLLALLLLYLLERTKDEAKGTLR